nr:TRAP transporter substrate-binding protein DctP [uncultured Agathobaculum sp.]
MNNSLRRVPALLLLLLLCGCGRGGEAAEIRYYRLASGQSANHLANQACERFCSLVEKESGGAIQIIPSFENELGTDASALEQCVYGGIDFVRTPLSAAAAYAPQLSALQLPYEYTSDEHLFRVLDGDVGADAMDSLEEQGLTGLSYFYAGYRCFFTTDKPITGLDDMQGLRLGTEDSSQMQQIIPQWGAVAVTLPPDEFALALRTHRIDGAESTLPTYVDSGYYRLAPYWTYDRHSYNADVLVASSETWAEFSPEEQQLLLQCAAEAASWQRAHWQGAEVKAMLRASRSGCYMALLSEEQTELFRDAAQPLYEHLSETQKEVVRRVRALSDESD